jgi:hypothetical protein
MWTIVTVEIEEFHDGSNCFARVQGATSDSRIVGDTEVTKSLPAVRSGVARFTGKLGLHSSISGMSPCCELPASVSMEAVYRQ